MICRYCGHHEDVHATDLNAARKCLRSACECPGFKPVLILEPGIPETLTLHDRFAMAALTGLIARGIFPPRRYIDEAFDIADEVMAARMKRKGKK